MASSAARPVSRKSLRQAHDFERGINLEQQRLVFPVQKMRIHAHAERRMFGAGCDIARQRRGVCSGSTEGAPSGVSGKRSGGRPVMRIPAWPLWRMFMPMSKAVICSTIRAFSSGPPSMARTPGILAASSRVSCAASASLLQTMTSQSSGASVVEQLGGNIVEGGDHAHFFGHKFGGLLRGGTLPYAEGARGASADAGRQRNCGVDEDAARRSWQV